jgi:hypothetical protein
VGPEKIDLAATEDDAFWAWAIIETLRHTGVRAEELLEITHLALVSYRLPDTGEIVPLLQIVPSKSNEERLLLVSPELASVLASIVKRLRDANNGAIPLEPRYDPKEKTTSPPLPHLFQRKIGVAVLGHQRDPGQAAAHRGHRPRRPTRRHRPTAALHAPRLPKAVHDGSRHRRPAVHIAAKLLGHHNIATVESYLAVFQDELIRTYRAFLDKRRAARPESDAG